MTENMKKEITNTYNTTSMFFVTFLQLGAAWPFLTSEKLPENLSLVNKKAAPQEERDWALPFPSSSTRLNRGEEIQKRGCRSCDLEKPSPGLAASSKGSGATRKRVGFLSPGHTRQ